jgi:ADP-heptose:LPS heptosyltransferase
LGDRLAKSGARVEFILGPDEAPLRGNLESRLPEGCRLLPPMGIENLMNAFKGFRAFVSSDTGPMHLAWSMGIPTIAIFVDSEIEKFRPLSPGSLAVDGTRSIDIDIIYNHVLEILNPAKVS